MASTEDLVAALRELTEPKYRCLVCYRTLLKPEPHWCADGFMKHAGSAARKRGLSSIWERIWPMEGEEDGKTE